MTATPAGLTHLRLPAGAGFVDAAAEAAWIALGGRADLSAGLLILPAFNAATALRAALARAAQKRGHTVLLPPRLETVDSWLERAPLAAPAESRAARSAGLYRLLKLRGWYGGDPPWETVHALLALVDELSLAMNASGDAGERELNRAIEAHYRATAARIAGAEAQLVLEVWRAFAKTLPGAPLDPGLARRLRQQAWLAATAACSPAAPVAVVWIGSGVGAPLPAPELAFAQALAAHVPVTLVAPAALPPLLDAAWEPRGAPLAERARALPPVLFETAALGILCAHSLEQEAAVAAAQVLRWLGAGRRRIGIVAFDRLTARRMRALLERRQVLLADESGWKLSTTSAATCAMRWVEVATGGFLQRDVLDWLKSPHVFNDIAPARREAAVARLEAAIRENNVLAGIAAMRKALAGGRRRRNAADEDETRTRDLALLLLERMDQAARPWARRAATLAEWCALLIQTLNDLDAGAALAADAAGKAVLDLLAHLGAALDARDAPRYTVGEWRAWLAAELETATFRDAAIDSPVALTTLRGALLRDFEAVLLVGADAAHLPGEAADAPLLTPRLRAELRLETREQASLELRDQLALLLAQTPQAAATWRASESGDPNPLAPLLARLDALYRAAGRPSLIVQAPVAAHAGTPAAAAAPAPSAPPLLPRRVSVSAYGSLIVCPYQFFARHLLGLNEQDQVREEFEKRDYGEWVHRLLNRFHQQFPRITGVPRGQLVAAMQALAEEEFASAVEFNYLSLGWKLRWEHMVAPYFAWQLEREEKGWSWQAGELRREVEIGGILLGGRLDRVDRGADGSLEVLDYKTQSANALKAKVNALGEDVQLAVYSILEAEHGECRASFVSLDGDAVTSVAANDGHLPQDEWLRVEILFHNLNDAAGMPANGIASACKYCEMRGLCRRDVWAEVNEAEDEA